jgi:hypothetical protein
VTQDRRYEHALSAALVILNEIDRTPDMEKRNRLALAVFSILHAMDSWEEERRESYAQFSVN